jgi:hypothetical protein
MLENPTFHNSIYLPQITKNWVTKLFEFQINSTQYVDFMMIFVLIKQNCYLWAM